MTNLRRLLIHPIALLAVAMPSAPVLADNAGGPDPYAAGFGFDLPSEAAWGGWARGDAGTLHAEWDVFNDRSHGGAADRSAAPDVGSFGTSSAWLGWNAGTFVSGTANLYSFTVPEVFSIELAGPVPAVPLRVALQVEVQGQPLDPDSFSLNDTKPVQSIQTYRNAAFPSPMGPTDLVHRLLIWELPAPPASFVIRFASKQPHVSLTQAAVDIGPLTTDGPAPLPNPEPSAGSDRTVLVKLPAEELDADFAARLHAQRPRWFPETWVDRELIFKQKTLQRGKRINRSLKGAIPALFHDEAAGGSANTVFVDIYRPDAAGDAKIAECRLNPAKKRRWQKVALENGTIRVGTAVYRLDVQAAEFPAKPGKSQLKNRFGACDSDAATEGVQTGVPEIREGDYGVFRREPN